MIIMGAVDAIIKMAKENKRTIILFRLWIPLIQNKMKRNQEKR